MSDFHVAPSMKTFTELSNYPLNLHLRSMLNILLYKLIEFFAFFSGGFFTMKHEVVDLSSLVAKLYSVMDMVALETMVTEQLSLFERQWKTVLILVDVEG